uniref:NADH-ubiquinone oxidoreductase chain 6 n=1 Tax=Curculionoidea sp. 13 KM-2017 TaxID=2219396 RepID=A0A346RHF1_9CUCU|nr:NADH dehydrogenase subunit 6 [Curculionoidea sp. 13 KM-2017]
MMMNFMFSIMFIFMNHPMSLGSILLIQTVLVSLLSGLIFNNFWFSYILFLVMIGGMMVLFIYMTSIASNEKFNLPKNKMILFFSCLIVTLLLITIIQDNHFLSMILYKYTKWILLNSSNYIFNLSKFYNLPNIQIFVIMVSYLLITLIVTMKIIGKPSKSLRQQ